MLFAEDVSGKPASPANPRKMNEHDVATALGVKVSTLRRWRMFRRGPRFVKVGRLVRYLEADVEYFLANQPTGGEVR